MTYSAVEVGLILPVSMQQVEVRVEVYYCLIHSYTLHIACNTCACACDVVHIDMYGEKVAHVMSYIYIRGNIVACQI